MANTNLQPNVGAVAVTGRAPLRILGPWRQPGAGSLTLAGGGVQSQRTVTVKSGLRPMHQWLEGQTNVRVLRYNEKHLTLRTRRVAIGLPDRITHAVVTWAEVQ